MVVLLTLIARASGHPDNNLGWIIFMGLLICGVSMIVQTLRLPYLGLGGLVVTNFNVPFMAISTLALAKGGPGLLASLLVASMLLQVLVTLRFASFRRIFTPTVSGTVVMLVAISAVPFIVENAFARVSDAPCGTASRPDWWRWLPESWCRCGRRWPGVSGCCRLPWRPALPWRFPWGSTTLTC